MTDLRLCRIDGHDVTIAGDEDLVRDVEAEIVPHLVAAPGEDPDTYEIGRRDRRFQRFFDGMRVSHQVEQ